MHARDALRMAPCMQGCPMREAPEAAAARMARMALDMLRAVERFESPLHDAETPRSASDSPQDAPPERKLQIRVGMHSGEAKGFSWKGMAGHSGLAMSPAAHGRCNWACPCLPPCKPRDVHNP